MRQKSIACVLPCATDSGGLYRWRWLSWTIFLFLMIHRKNSNRMCLKFLWSRTKCYWLHSRSFSPLGLWIKNTRPFSLTHPMKLTDWVLIPHLALGLLYFSNYHDCQLLRISKTETQVISRLLLILKSFLAWDICLIDVLHIHLVPKIKNQMFSRFSN